MKRKEFWLGATDENDFVLRTLSLKNASLKNGLLPLRESLIFRKVNIRVDLI